LRRHDSLLQATDIGLGGIRPERGFCKLAKAALGTIDSAESLPLLGAQRLPSRSRLELYVLQSYRVSRPLGNHDIDRQLPDLLAKKFRVGDWYRRVGGLQYQLVTSLGDLCGHCNAVRLPLNLQLNRTRAQALLRREVLRRCGSKKQRRQYGDDDAGSTRAHVSILVLDYPF
jgi:hypothetical protein